VAISIIFNSARAIHDYCPKCREDNGDYFPAYKDIKYWKYKIMYRRSILWNSSQPLLSSSMMTTRITPATEILPMEFQVPEILSSSERKRKMPHDEDNEMALFRRVRIKTFIELPEPDVGPGSLEAKEIYGNIDEAVPNLEYLDQIAGFHREHGTDLNRFPSIDKRPIDLYKLKRAVEARGGFERVCTKKKWAEIGRDLGYRGRIMMSVSASLENSYRRWLSPYEEYLKSVKEDNSQWDYGGPLTPSPAGSPMRREDFD